MTAPVPVRARRRRARRGALAVAAVLLLAVPGSAQEGPTVQSGFAVADDGTRLAWEAFGTGDTIMVVHGGPGLGFRYLQPGLAPLAQRHTLVFFDQRGAGRSDLPDSTRFALYDYVNDIEAVRRHLGAARVVVLGHSWGGALAALYAAAYPQHTRALVLLAPMPPRALWADSASAAARRAAPPETSHELGRLAQEMQRGPDPVAACRAHMAILLTTMSTVAPDSAAVRCDASAEVLRARERVVRWTTHPLGAWDWRGTVAWIDVPTLVVHGSDDTLPLAAAREWAGTIAEARLVVIPGARHMPQLDAPARFASALARFLDGLEHHRGRRR